MAALWMGCFPSLPVISLVRKESPLSFQLPRHFMLMNCEREVANDMKSLFMAGVGPRPPDGPYFSHAAGLIPLLVGSGRRTGPFISGAQGFGGHWH